MTAPFTMLPNILLTDKRLCRDTVCVIFYLQSKPANWVFWVTEIRASLGLSEKVWRKCSQQLRNVGIITIAPTAKGKQLKYIGLTDYIKFVTKPPVDKVIHNFEPSALFHRVAKGTYNNTDLSNTDIITTAAIVNTAREALPATQVAAAFDNEVFTQLNNKAKAVGIDAPEIIRQGLCTYTASFVDDKIELYAIRNTRRTIKNPAGWLKRAMENDFPHIKIQDKKSQPKETIALLNYFDENRSVVNEQRKTPCEAFVKLKERTQAWDNKQKQLS